MSDERAPLDDKWAEFQRTDEFKEAMKFVSDKELIRELLFSAMSEGYHLGIQDGVDDAAGKGAFGS